MEPSDWDDDPFLPDNLRWFYEHQEEEPDEADCN